MLVLNNTWIANGKRYYVFTVLPFGLSTACYVFTKVTRPLLRLWRVKVVMYIDNGVVVMP